LGKFGREAPIPRFYFHFRHDARIERDEEGVEFASFEAACTEAYAAIPSLWSELQQEGQDPTYFAFEITDAQNRLLLDLPFLEGMTRHSLWTPHPNSTVPAGVKRCTTWRLNGPKTAGNLYAAHTRPPKNNG
jgi:hypothetical protein